MALNIPNPNESGLGLLQGLDTGSNLMNRILQNRIAQKQLGINQQAETRMQSLVPSEIAEREARIKDYSRAQKILPFLLQQYQDEHNEKMSKEKIQKLYDDVIINAFKGSSSSSPTAASQSNGYSLSTSPENLTSNSQDNIGKNTAQENESILRPGNQSLYAFDKIAGLPGSGISQPKITRLPNGDIQTQYPSGKVTIQKVKGQSGENTIFEKEMQTQNAKSAKQLVDTADTLMKYASNNEEISKILDRNKNVTGTRQGLGNMINLGGKDVGAFNNLAVPLQAALAKELSQRGGAVVAQLAAGGKYNLYKSHTYNEGVRDETTKQIIDSFNRLNERYKGITGKDLPYKLTDFYNNYGKEIVKLYKNGIRYLVPSDQVKSAKERGYSDAK